MNQYVTGEVIRALREKNGYTQAEPADERHRLQVEQVEDEYYVTVNHEMTKQHYISFLAASSYDRMSIVKFYPEGNAAARFKISGGMRIYFFCNRDGLFVQQVPRKR